MSKSDRRLVAYVVAFAVSTIAHLILMADDLSVWSRIIIVWPVAFLVIQAVMSLTEPRTETT